MFCSLCTVGGRLCLPACTQCSILHGEERVRDLAVCWVPQYRRRYGVRHVQLTEQDTV